MMAKALNPAVTSSYRASKNRRKSNNTLPPFSLAYCLNAVFAIYFACSFSVAVRPNCDKR